jgi:shikimate kinase
MEGYYDYTPTAELHRHLVIAGYLGDETRRIGYQLASLTGLPVTDLDRKIEHHAGKSVWELIWSEGEGRYRELERRYLGRLLDERPWSILTLGDGALIDAENRRRVSAEADLVVLDLDVANVYWRLKATPAAAQEFWHPLHAGPLERFEQVRPFHQRREPGFAGADHRIAMLGRGGADVVELLLGLIPEL